MGRTAVGCFIALILEFVLHFLFFISLPMYGYSLHYRSVRSFAYPCFLLVSRFIRLSVHEVQAHFLQAHPQLKLSNKRSYY
jgi:hypothetical protein